VRIPGLKMTIVQADGTNVSPVDVEEFRIGVAETFDVLVTPSDEAHAIFAQAQDRSGYAKAILAIREGMTASVPPMAPRPLRSMADMGMDMGGMSMGGMDMSGGKATPGMDMSGGQSMQMNMDDKPMSGMDMGGGKSMPEMNMDHGSMPGMDMGSMQKMPPAVPSTNADGIDPMTLSGKPSVDNVAMKSAGRQSEAGTGLDGNGRQVLTYSQLSALKKSELGPPTRELQFHLTGNMERWTWGFDGKRFSEAEPINIKLGERVRFLLINDTMMEHPIHLHGFLFELDNGQDAMPMKHTINVKPGEKVGVIFTADVPGYWAFHCHLLYHMEMGMFRTVVVA